MVVNLNLPQMCCNRAGLTLPSWQLIVQTMHFTKYTPPSPLAPAFARDGKELADLLERGVDSLIHSLEKARPAVEGILDQLWERFGERAKDKDLHKLAGNMIAHLLRQLGYEVHRKNVPVVGNPAAIKTGATYRGALDEEPVNDT